MPDAPTAPSEQDIVTAYRLLLGREPDADGLAHYVSLSRDGQLSLGRLREILLNSDEARRNTSSRMSRIEIAGVTVFYDPDEADFSGTLQHEGAWEPHIVSTIAEHLPCGGVYVDIGANLGIMAFQAANQVGPTGRILAFEPEPRNIDCFLRGVVANGFGHVMLYPVALSDAPAVFAMGGSSNGFLLSPDQNGLMAQSMRGDDLLRGEERIDLIKIDIEGHEPRALRGLARTLERLKPMMLVEFNPRCLRDHAGADPAGFAAQIFALTDAVVAIEPGGERTELVSADALLGFWNAVNDRVATAALLPDGMLHLDLLFRPR